MSLHFVKGDKLKQKSKKFYQEIFLLFSLPKNTFVSHSNLNNEEAAKTYVRMFQASNNNFIWFEQVEKKDEVTYYFGQADEDIINEDKVNILDPLKSSFSITFDLKKINLGNGRFMEDEKGNVFPGIVVNKLNPNQLKLLRNLGLRIVSLKNKKKNEVKYLLIFFNTENHSKSKKVLENLVSNVIFQHDENNNLTIVKIYENNLNQNFSDESAVDQKTSPENIKDSSTINTNHPDSNGSINTDNIIKENLNKTVKSQHNSSFNQQKYKNKWTSPSNTKDYGVEYAAISLRNDGMVLNYKIPLNFKVYEIKEICNYHQIGISIKNLSKKYDQPTNIIENIILNEDLGKFDEIIKQWEQEKKSTPAEIIKQWEQEENSTPEENIQTEFKDSIRERPIITSITNKPYKISEVTNYGNLKESINILSFNIMEARNIHELYNEGQFIQAIANKYNLPVNNIKRIILRFDAGDFDKFLVKILKENPSNKNTYLNIKNNAPFNIKIDDDENIFDINENNESIPLELKSKDINLILNEYINNRSIKSLSSYFSVNYDNLERILNRLIVGDFDEILSDDLKDKLSKSSSGLSSGVGVESDDGVSSGLGSGVGVESDDGVSSGLGSGVGVGSDDGVSSDEEGAVNVESDLSVNDDNLLDFADEVEEYSKYLHLKSDGRIISESALLSVKGYEIEPIFNSFKNGESVESLSKEFNLTDNLIKRTIFNYESGNFDKILSKWVELEKAKESFKSHYKFSDPIRERPYLSESMNIPYRISRVSANGHLKISYHKLDFTILEAKAIHEAYNAGQNIDELGNKYNLSENTIKRIIVRYDAGDFDKFLMEFLKENTTEKGNITKIKNNEAFKNLNINNEGFITFSSKYSDNLSLGLTIPDIKLLFNEYKKNRSIKSLSDNFNMIEKSTKKIINRIIAGDFKKLLSLDYETLIINNILNDNINEIDSNSLTENKDTQVTVIHFADEVDEYSKILTLKSDGKLLSGYAPLSVKVYEVEPIFNSFMNGESVESLSKQFNVTEYIIKKTIFNYESGNFDEVIKQWNEKVVELGPVKQNDEFEDPIRERVHLTKSVDVPYHKFNVLGNGHLKGKYQELTFTIFDARNMHESYNAGQTIEDLAKIYNFTDITIKRIIGRYDAGDFNNALIKVLKENPSDASTDLYIKNNLPFKYLEKDNNGNIFYKNFKGQHLPFNLNEKDINLISSEYKNNRSIKSLSDNFNIDYDSMERIINRIIVGDFNEIPLIKEESLNNNIPISNEKIIDSSKDKESSVLSEVISDIVDSSKDKESSVLSEVIGDIFDSSKEESSKLSEINNDIVDSSKEESGRLSEINDKINFILNYYDNILGKKSENSEIIKEINNEPNKFNNQEDSINNLNNVNNYKTKEPVVEIEEDEPPIISSISNSSEESVVEIEEDEPLIISSISNSSEESVVEIEEEELPIISSVSSSSEEPVVEIEEEPSIVSSVSSSFDESELFTEINELKDQIEKLKIINKEKVNANDKLILENQKTSDLYAQKIKNLNESLEDVNSLKIRINTLKDENYYLRRDNKIKSNDLENLKTEIEDLENMNSDINSLKNIGSEDDNGLNTEIDDLENMDFNISSLNDVESEVVFSLKSEISSLKNHNKKKSDKIEELVKENNKYIFERNNNINELNDYRYKFEELDNQIKKLKRENANLKFDNADKSGEIKRLLVKNEESPKNYDQKINDLNDSLAEYDKLTSEVKDLKTELSSLMSVNKEKSEEIERLLVENKEASNKYNQKINNFNDSLTEYDKLKSENEDLKKINKVQIEKYDKLVQTNKKSELEYIHKINNLKSQGSNQKQDKGLLSEIDILKIENEGLKTANKAQTKKFDKLVEDKKRSELEYIHKINNLKSQSINYEGNAELLSEIDILKSENANLKAFNKNKSGELDKLVMKNKKTSEAYDQKIQDLNDSINNQERNKELVSKINILKSENEDLKKINKVQIEKFDKLVEDNKRSELEYIHTINDLKSRVNTYEVNGDLISEISILKSENANLKIFNKNKIKELEIEKDKNEKISKELQETK